MSSRAWMSARPSWRWPAETRRRSSLGQLRFHHADAYDTGLPRGTAFDLVYCRFLLCHLAQPERRVREMRRLLLSARWRIGRCGRLWMWRDIFARDPPSAAVERMRELMLAVGTARGVDYCLGVADCMRLFRDAGFAATCTASAAARISRCMRRGEGKLILGIGEPICARSGAGDDRSRLVTTSAELDRLSRELAAVARGAKRRWLAQRGPAEGQVLGAAGGPTCRGSDVVRAAGEVRYRPAQRGVRCGMPQTVYLAFGFHRPSAAPVGSMMMLNQPIPITSVTSFMT